MATVKCLVAALVEGDEDVAGETEEGTSQSSELC